VRHVIMPMVKPERAGWQPGEDAATEGTIVPVPEPEPVPVTPAESAYRTRDAANERRLTRRAERRAAALPRCATCDTLSEPGDNFCGLCGSPLGEPAPVATRPAPVTTPATIAGYSERNQERILTACPHATEVRTFNGWLAAGRVVVKGQKGIRLVAPDTMDAGKITSIKAVSVFDVTQTQERTQRAAA
jgi:hypothetical protein